MVGEEPSRLQVLEQWRKHRRRIQILCVFCIVFLNIRIRRRKSLFCLRISKRTCTCAKEIFASIFEKSKHVVVVWFLKAAFALCMLQQKKKKRTEDIRVVQTKYYDEAIWSVVNWAGSACANFVVRARLYYAPKTESGSIPSYTSHWHDRPRILSIAARRIQRFICMNTTTIKPVTILRYFFFTSRTKTILFMTMCDMN